MATAAFALLTFGNRGGILAVTDKKPDTQDLAKKAYAVFENSFAKRHHGKQQKGNAKYDVLDWSSLTATAPSGKVLAKPNYKGVMNYIDAAKSSKSLIVLRINDNSMPPGKQLSQG